MALLKRIQTPLVLVLFVLVIGLYGSFGASTVTQRVIIALFVNLILVLSLQMFMGNSGVVSFAHVGFMGIGAYTSILFTLPEAIKGRALRELYPVLEGLSADFIPALLIGGLVAALVAAVIGFPIMRLSGSASVIATFALLVIIHVVLNNWTQVTNGPRSVFGVEKLTTVPGTMAWAVLAVVLTYIYKVSRFGLMLRASREDEKAARSIGINIVLNRWFAFVTSAFLAGVAGGLQAHFLGQFNADEFYLTRTFLILSMLVIGGMSSVSGAVLGVTVVAVLAEGLRNLEGVINASDLLAGQVTGMAPVVVSLITIIILILRPAGIMGEHEIGFSREKSPSKPAEQARQEPERA